MITDEELVKEFIDIVDRYYPKTGQILQHCCVKVLTSYSGTPPQRLHFIGIYCAESMISAIRADLDVLWDVAENMGLAQVVCWNANRLLNDPMAHLHQSNPRLWLELQWLVSQDSGG